MLTSLARTQSHFGFVVGGWNQAYQFDTLPLAVDSEKDLQPGDLIFISGLFFSFRINLEPRLECYNNL